MPVPLSGRVAHKTLQADVQEALDRDDAEKDALRQYVRHLRDDLQHLTQLVEGFRHGDVAGERSIGGSDQLENGASEAPTSGKVLWNVRKQVLFFNVEAFTLCTHAHAHAP
jgi:hypothetical protein